MILLLRNNYNKLIEINIIGLMVIFYLFRAAFPYLKYPFILFFAGLIVYSLIKFRKEVLSNLKELIRCFYLPIILLIIIVVAFLFSSKIFLAVFKDISNTIILLTIFLIMSFFIKTKQDLQLLFAKIIQYIIVFAIIISVLLIIKFYVNIQDADKILNNNSYLSLISNFFSSDYNFVILPVLFGLLGMLFLNEINWSILIKVLYNITLIIFTTLIIFSNSKRGLISLSLIILVLIVIQLKKPSKTRKIISQLRFNSFWLTRCIIILTVFLLVFIFILPIEKKRSVLNALAIPVRIYKSSTFNLISKYSTILTNLKGCTLEKMIWEEKPNPLYPDSGWDSRIGKLVYPLSGEKVEIVPGGSVGFRMDKTCDASPWNGNAYSYISISNLLEGDSSISKSDCFLASVYCFVSNDFNGTWARISAEGSASGNIVQYYDLDRRGEWQKLSIFFKSDGTIPPVYLYWAKAGVSNFESLEGFVIFAYPEYGPRKPDPKNPIYWGSSSPSFHEFPLTGKNFEIVPDGSIGYRMDNKCTASTWSNNAYSFTDISVLFSSDSLNVSERIFCASVYCFVSNDFNGNWARISAEGEVKGNIINEYDLTKKGTWQKLQIKFKANSGIPPVLLYWSKKGVTNFSNLKGYLIFAHPQYILVNQSCDDLTISGESWFKQYTDGIPYKASILSLGSSKLNIFFVKDNDPVRKWAEKLISEDTIYYGYKNDLKVDTILRGYSFDRLIRWQFALKIYSNEYDLIKKMFGGGFNFLNWYGYYFMKDKTYSDYPHNPFLSILLYSGIIGLGLYLFLLYKAFYYYIKYIKEYYLFFIFFLITFFFSFFSAGSPFDPPIMGFFIMLPFFIHSIHKRDKEISNN